MFLDLNIIIPSKNEKKNLEFIIPKIKEYCEDITVVDGNFKMEQKSFVKKIAFYVKII